MPKIERGRLKTGSDDHRLYCLVSLYGGCNIK